MHFTGIIVLTMLKREQNGFNVSAFKCMGVDLGDGKIPDVAEKVGVF